MSLMITQAHPSSCHVTYYSTSPHHRPSVAFSNTAHTPSHSNAPYRRSSQFFTKLLPVTLHIPLMQYVFSYNIHTHTLNTVPTGAPLFTAEQGGLQVSTTHVLEIMKDVLSHELCSQFQNPWTKNPYILRVILTDKHNHTDLINWLLLIQCYYMFWLSTSAIITSASVHKKNKRESPLLTKSGLKLL